MKSDANESERADAGADDEGQMEGLEQRGPGFGVQQSVPTDDRLLHRFEDLDAGDLADLHGEHLRGRHHADAAGRQIDHEEERLLF